RVHLAHLGHPLIGDPLYGRSRSGRQTTALPAATLAALRAFPRQALHAFRLGFTHPTTKKLKSFQTEIYIDINVLLKLLDSD
ncbi:MAG: RNA pseudouridine synthase, partial [Rhodospirillales bacterium]|nr:RNA pseudouridine synthase [Rhodospirillales bacterium]